MLDMALNTQTVTLKLPVALIERAQLAATVLNYPLEQVLTDVLAATLPDLTTAPAGLQAELVQMSFLDDQQLWEIAHSQLSDAEQVQLQQLNESELGRPLNAEEYEQQQSLLNEYERVMVRKARAYALLSARSGRLLLSDLA
jgi:hypothetical protein